MGRIKRVRWGFEKEDRKGSWEGRVFCLGRVGEEDEFDQTTLYKIFKGLIKHSELSKIR